MSILLSILWRLFPYLMVICGLFVCSIAAPTLINGGETAPSTVLVSDVSTESPKKQWLKLTGGGLDLGESIAYIETKKNSLVKNTKAYYVPFVTSVDAQTLPDHTIVLVEFEPNDFLRTYPERKGFKAIDIEGERKINSLFPKELKEYITTEFQLPLERVVVIEAGKHPLQRSEALIMIAIALGIAALGALWAWKRNKKPVVVL